MSGNRQARTMASKIKVKNCGSQTNSETSKRMKLVGVLERQSKAMGFMRERNVRFERRYVLLGKPDFVLEAKDSSVLR